MVKGQCNEPVNTPSKIPSTDGLKPFATKSNPLSNPQSAYLRSSNPWAGGVPLCAEMDSWLLQLGGLKPEATKSRQAAWRRV
jgi:hypothetical protein